MERRRIFITGTAGFIGYHLAELLLAQGHIVDGYDGLTDYYDVSLKQRRHAMLNQHEGFSATEAMPACATVSTIRALISTPILSELSM